MDGTTRLLEEAVREHQAGELQKAEPLYRRVLRVDPEHPSALYHLGTLELQRANVAAGIDLLKRAVAVLPDAAEIHNNLGIAYKAQGEFGAAAEAYERALKADPEYAAAYFNLADLSHELGQIDTAIAFYLRAVELEPADVESCRRLGDIFFDRRNWDVAEKCFRQALSQPGEEFDRQSRLELMSRLGIACIKQEKLGEAAATYREILELAPEMSEIHSNLAFVFERQGNLHDALAAGLRAVEQKPTYAEGHNNLGVAYRALHRLEDAATAFARAAQLKPDFALARFNLGTVQLMRGDYRPGWDGYEFRNLTLETPPRQFAVLRWDGKPIPGQTLLVHTEQGYGDTIQFARFLAQAKERSQARIILEGPAALLPLLHGIAGADRVVEAERESPAVDCEIPLPSLPRVLGVELATLPAHVPYLTVPEDRQLLWRDRLAAIEKSWESTASLKIGIVWAGNPAQQQDVVRSCALSDLAPLGEIPGIRWFSLQKGIDEAAIRNVWPSQTPLAVLDPLLTDFADTAAVLCQLDLLISVDTSVAHLAGALGRPCWTLLCHTPDWRWQLDRPDSAWYPTMKLFRQPLWGDWGAVMKTVGDELKRLVEEIK